MEFNKIYKAPSLPKLSRRNISSALITGAPVSAVKLKQTKFNFIKSSKKDKEPQLTGTPIVTSEPAGIAESLVETNRILVEIQNQLATDFALRIVEEKKRISKLRTDKEKKKVSEKEGAIEGIKGFAAGVKRQFDGVLAPAKSMFERIVEFFKTVLSALAVNVAFEWLKDPKNQKLLGDTFKFLADNWKWIVGAIVLGQVISLVGKILAVARGIQSVFAFLSANPIVLGLISVAGLSILANKITGQTEAAPIQATNKAKAQTGRALGVQGIGGVGDLGPTTPYGLLQGVDGMHPSIGHLEGGLIKEIPAVKGHFFFANQPIRRFARGGIVSGKGPIGKDTIPAMLSKGEFVQTEQATSRFRPLFEDFNQNSGRLWEQFTQAVTKLDFVTKGQKGNNEKFDKSIEEFNKYVKKEIDKKRQKDLTKTNTRVTPPPTPTLPPSAPSAPVEKSSPSLKPVPKSPNLTPASTGNGNINLVPFDLPPIGLQQKPPEIMTPKGLETDVPAISSVDVANLYLQLTPEKYGIFV